MRRVVHTVGRRLAGIGLAAALASVAMPARATQSPTWAELHAIRQALPAGQQSCGLRLDGVGPDARCGRYRDACLRHGNPPVRCEERLEACVRCAVGFRDCEKRATGFARLLTSCERCITGFKRCTREYERRLPARRP
jgi:hypothetical protein